MTIVVDTPQHNIIVTTVDSAIVVEVPSQRNVVVQTAGAPGQKGDKGDKGDTGSPGADSTVPGPPGPSTVSSDAGNVAIIGTDSFIFVPPGLPETDALGNTGYGEHTIEGATTGTANTAIGQWALASVTEGMGNVALGGSAARFLTTGNNNIVSGNRALAVATAAQGAIALGAFALESAMGDYNIAIGYAAAQTAGAGVVAVGAWAGEYVASAGDVVALGFSAKGNQGGTAIGAGAQARGVYSTALGAGAIAVQDNQIMLGTSSSEVHSPGGSVTKSLRVSDTSAANIELRVDADGERMLIGTRGGTRRWAFAFGNADVEAGADSGSNFSLYSYSDGGGLKSQILMGDRATGELIHQTVPVSPYALVNKQYADGIVATHAAAADPHPQYLTSAELSATLPPETDALNNTGYGLNTILAATGVANTALGRSALQAVVAGAEHTAVGYMAAAAVVGGVGNVAIGCLALRAATSGGSNTSIGSYSHYALTTGSGNVAIGRSADGLVTTASYHTHVGYQAGPYVAGTGGDSTSVGRDSKAHTGASAFGSGAEAQGQYSTAIGYGAIATENNQITIGRASERAHFPSRITGGSDANSNTTLGAGAATGLTTGVGNVAIGPTALLSISTGSYNVVLGQQAGYKLTTGSENFALGANALFSGVGCSYNVAVGSQALYSPKGIAANATVSSSKQVAIGWNTGQYAAGTGDYITVVGTNAVAHDRGTAIGADSEARGWYSTAIGYGAIATLDNQIMLGRSTERVYVNNDPVAALEVATKRYVDLRERFTALLGSQIIPHAVGTNLSAWTNVAARGISRSGSSFIAGPSGGVYAISLTVEMTTTWPLGAYAAVGGYIAPATAMATFMYAGGTYGSTCTVITALNPSEAIFFQMYHTTGASMTLSKGIIHIVKISDL